MATRRSSASHYLEQLDAAAVLLCGAAYPFLSWHIYFPVGVATMVLMAGGFALLMWAKLRGAKVLPERTVKPVAAV